MQLIHLTEAFNSSDENCRLKFWGEGGEEPFTIYFKIISQVPSLSISFTRWTHLHVKVHIYCYISISIITVESLWYGQFSFTYMPS